MADLAAVAATATEMVVVVANPYVPPPPLLRFSVVPLTLTDRPSSFNVPASFPLSIVSSSHPGKYQVGTFGTVGLPGFSSRRAPNALSR